MEYSIERLETLSDEHLREIADLTAQAFAGDPAWTTLIGGDLSLNTEYCNAEIRASMLEGEVYILTIEKGGKREIASWAVFFPPGSVLMELKLNGNWDLTNFSKK